MIDRQQMAWNLNTREMIKAHSARIGELQDNVENAFADRMHDQEKRIAKLEAEIEWLKRALVQLTDPEAQEPMQRYPEAAIQ